MSIADDPLARLENLAKRQVAEQEAAKTLTQARVKLVMGKDAKAAFFATLALRLKPEPNWNIETAATNGRQLLYNPKYINELSVEQRIGLLAHEVMHCAQDHMGRRMDREMRKWNVACDLATNPLIRDAQYSLPPGGLMPGHGQYKDLPEGLSAEEYYSRIPHPPDGNGNDPGGSGGVMDSGDPSQAVGCNADWRVAVSQAANVAIQRGELPGGLARMVAEIQQPAIPWQDVLRDFLSRTLTAREDYTWKTPNRRFIGQGIYLPGLRSESMGHVVIAVDTSGSIDEATLKAFAGEVNGILDCQPCRVSVVYCDAQVQRVEEWQPSDGPLTLVGHGGGGTSHQPIWDWISGDCDDEPACVVCLTDGYTNFGTDPDVPVLWALTHSSTATPPFGRVLHIKS